jgi:biotin carboxyl carrier protein
VATVKITLIAGDRAYEVTVERRNGLFAVGVDGTAHHVDARKLEADFYSIITAGRSYEVSVEPEGQRYHVRHGAAKRTVVLTDPTRGGRESLRAGARGPENIVSVMPGKVVRVLVGKGDTVEAGQGLVVVEAMKMENEIAAPRAGKVAAVEVETGRPVEAGATLVVIE